MQVSTDVRDNGVVVSASGSIDHSSAAAFEEAAVPAVKLAVDAAGLLVVDLSDVDYMSSVGLRVLMLLAKAGKVDTVAVVISGLQPALQEIFQISHFDKIFKIYGSTEEALASGAA